MGNRTPKCHHCYGFMFVCPSVLYGCLDSVSLGWHGLCPSIRQKLVFCIKTVGTRKKLSSIKDQDQTIRVTTHTRAVLYIIYCCITYCGLITPTHVPKIGVLGNLIRCHWLKTVHFNILRAVVINHTYAAYQRQRSIISKDKVETNEHRDCGQTNRTDCFIFTPDSTVAINTVTTRIGLSLHGKKFSHTRYWALGPELIPVYRQSAHKWLYDFKPSKRQ